MGAVALRLRGVFGVGLAGSDWLSFRGKGEWREH